MGRRGTVRPAYGSGEENQTSELRESGVAGPADLRRRSQGASCLLPRSRGRGSGWGTGNGAARDGPTGVRLRARGIGRLNCESVVAGRLIWGRSAAKRRVAGAGVREGVKRPGNQLGVDRPPRGVAGNPSPGPNPPPLFGGRLPRQRRGLGCSRSNRRATPTRGLAGLGGGRSLGGKGGGEEEEEEAGRNVPRTVPFPVPPPGAAPSLAREEEQGPGPPGNRKPARKRSQRRIAGDLGSPDAPAEALEGPGEDSV